MGGMRVASRNEGKYYKKYSFDGYCQNALISLCQDIKTMRLMKLYKAIDSIIQKYTKLANNRYLVDYERQEVCFEFIDWLNDQKASCANREVDSVASVEKEEWATFCDVSDIDPRRKVHRKYGFDTLNYDSNEEW